MTRLRADQACLEAQMQQQIAQGLNAELAVPCPDCGVESGRACRDSLDRAVRTHLARSVAANRRDTEPCPGPSLTAEQGRYLHEVSPHLSAETLLDIYMHGAQQESLTRAAAREFYEQVIADADRVIRETIAGMQVPPIKWAETVRDPEPSKLYAWLGEGSSVVCPICDAEPGAECANILTGAKMTTAHVSRRRDEQARDDATKTPTASDCAPSPAASAPEAVASTPAEKLCANCSQPLGYGTKVLGNVVIGWHCGDCWSSVNLWDPEQSRTLDQRIAEAKSDDATECAWSTPTSEGEGWR